MPTLAKYRKMRDFARTAEPRGASRARPGRARAERSYVIQKHAARRLHYDFRLELDGALLSWAVPRGPNLDPSVKRLAVETEPHPLEYGGFEGTIPKGEYGGGTVMVWDRGTWESKDDARKGYEKGHLAFTIHGEKLNGDWHLVRTRPGPKGEKNWLLFKSRDDHARTPGDALLAEQENSALSGRTMEDIAAGRGGKNGRRVWHSNRGEAAASDTKGARAPRAKALPRKLATTEISGVRAGKLATHVEPELATLVDAAPEGDDFIHEIKFDGYRVLARIEAGNVTLLTRRGHDWTERMPVVAEALAALGVRTALIDGEVVMLDEHGVSDFQLLQNSLNGDRGAPLVYYAFDLLHLDGSDLRGAPLLERKALLRALLERVPRSLAETIRLSDHVVGRGPEFFGKACELGVEGIVSKRANAPYRSGRGRDWLKVKCTERQEFVLVGYTEPGGSRSHFGALLVAVRKGKKLVYAGRVGTGFSEASLAELHAKLARLESREPSVENPPRGTQARGVHWVRPELVAEVAFTGFTEDGVLRHPTFRGLRDDKSPKDVELEQASPRPSAKPGRSRRVRASNRAASDDYPLTNPDKVLYPKDGITKRELLDYYALVAERMLPHVGNRPLTLVRCPNGVGKPCFFQKHPGQGTPDKIRQIAIRESEGKAPYSVIDDAWGLFGLLQLGALEIHTWGSRADDFEHPDLLVFDIDPDPSVEFAAVSACAREVRALFDSAKLESFVKTTGGKGLHVCVPIAPELGWDQVKDFSGRIAQALAQRSPEKYVATQSKAKRKGKIYIDYLRNARGATFIAPYSTRARDGAPVAVPLDWDELTPRFEPRAFSVRTLARRLAAREKDPFERMASLRQKLRPNG
jgi:bifunctional non-homologous end joining protein LigD